MNFTREPLIETVIVPREGCRLVLRSSRNESQEEFTVDAVEIVSFGHALFYRSLEKPRPFLVPVNDYEVVEVKESRVVLKNAQFERTIKIGGGREGSLRKEEEEEQVLPIALEDEIADESGPQQPSHDKKRDRGRRNRRRRSSDEREDMRHRVEEQTSPTAQTSQTSQLPQDFKPAPPKEAKPAKEPQAAAPFTHLIPPPTTLISHNIQKYKDQQSGNVPPVEPEPRKEEEPKPEPDSDSTPISRVAIEPQPLSMQSTHLEGWNHFLS